MRTNDVSSVIIFVQETLGRSAAAVAAAMAAAAAAAVAAAEVRVVEYWTKLNVKAVKSKQNTIKTQLCLFSSFVPSP